MPDYSVSNPSLQANNYSTSVTVFANGKNQATVTLTALLKDGDTPLDGGFQSCHVKGVYLINYNDPSFTKLTKSGVVIVDIEGEFLHVVASSVSGNNFAVDDGNENNQVTFYVAATDIVNNFQLGFVVCFDDDTSYICSSKAPGRNDLTPPLSFNAIAPIDYSNKDNLLIDILQAWGGDSNNTTWSTNNEDGEHRHTNGSFNSYVVSVAPRSYQYGGTSLNPPIALDSDKSTCSKNAASTGNIKTTQPSDAISSFNVYTYDDSSGFYAWFPAPTSPPIGFQDGGVQLSNDYGKYIIPVNDSRTKDADHNDKSITFYMLTLSMPMSATGGQAVKNDGWTPSSATNTVTICDNYGNKSNITIHYKSPSNSKDPLIYI